MTLSEKSAPLKTIIKEINAQTGYDFVISVEDLGKAAPVSIVVENVSLRQALTQIFATQDLTFVIQERMVVVSSKNSDSSKSDTSRTQPLGSLSGVVKDEKNQPLPGATIKVVGSDKSTLTDKNGAFKLINIPRRGTLIVSFISYQTISIPYDTPNGPILVPLKPEPSPLNEVQVIGYGQTTKRFNTGSQSSISAADLEKQPVTNVMAALSGRMPGVFVQTTNGLPGGNVNIQIRGKGSITAGTNPLYVIDGVPFDGSANTAINPFAVKAVNGQVSPLNSLNPDDIESITVLKDADATSIYGSRGTNGVILITTKSAKGSQTSTDVKLSHGISATASQPNLLSLADYLQIRREAFINDNLTPTVANAPDLTLWSQTQSTDFQKYLFGNTAVNTIAQASINGGNELTRFSASGNYYQSGNVISKLADYTRGGIYLSINHHSQDGRFTLQLTNNIVLDRNSSPNLENATTGILLPPNFPLTDANGVNTSYAGNPLIDLNSRTLNKTSNVINNISLAYELAKSLNVKISGGYNKMELRQQRIYPLNSLLSGNNYSQFLQNDKQTIIIEPQLTFRRQIGFGELNLLVGGTYQDSGTDGQYLQVSSFSNEELMANFASGATVDNRTNIYLHYKYVSGFARVNYNISGKYIVNATIRRDGSSRFGPGYQFGNFGAAGIAWIFSEEAFLKHNKHLNYGKLRASYGTTGNDQIPDYQYLSTYQSSGRTYQGVSTFMPSRISNDHFHWETTRKLELALELGFFNSRVLVNTDYYQNRSSDQLVSYAIPSSTGFTSYIANLPAVIQNSGWEFAINTINVKKPGWSWTSSLNLTVPKNKLLSFQNLASSSYAQTFQIGYDISRVKGYQFIGVNPDNGNGIYADANGNAASNSSAYFANHTIGKTSPDLYGGIGNTFIYRNFSLDVFIQFSKQHAVGGIVYTAGQLVNSYNYAAMRWQRPGMVTDVPRASTLSDFYYTISSANFFNSSYLRLKNIALNYRLPIGVRRRLSVSKMNVFISAENLLTFWNKNIPLIDPEAGALGGGLPAIAPVKTVIAGIQFTF